MGEDENPYSSGRGEICSNFRVMRLRHEHQHMFCIIGLGDTDVGICWIICIYIYINIFGNRQSSVNTFDYF